MIALLAWGCAEERSADEAFREFLRLSFAGERERAWALVDEGDRAAAAIRAEAALALGVELDDPSELVHFDALSSPFAIKLERIEPASASEQILHYKRSDGASFAARMRRSGGSGWRVALGASEGGQ